jgi:threonine/homoserine/homoserine lactone efflux protein
MPINTHLLILFLATSSVAFLAPGPDMLYVLGAGMRGGRRAGLLATAGVATSEAVHVALAAAGLSALLAAAPTAFTAMRLAGAAYLIYLGIQMIRHRRDRLDPASAAPVSGRRTWLRGLLTNLVNPKMVTFTVAFLPQFVDPALGRVWLQFAILGTMIVAMEFAIDGTVAIFAGRIGAWLARRESARRRIDAATGGLFIGLGIRLAAER